MDAIDEWTRAYERVSGIAAGLTDEQAELMIPTCPAWSVHDLIAHMIGVDADCLAGEEADDHNDGWTQAQVVKREGRSTAQLLHEWAGIAGPLREWMEVNGTRPLGDVTIHEQDLRGALDLPGARDTDAFYFLRDRMAGGFASAVEHLPPIALIGQAWQWASRGEPGEADVVLRADDYDLTRALMSRRSAAQVRGWTQRGDVGPYLPALAGLGPLPAHDIVE